MKFKMHLIYINTILQTRMKTRAAPFADRSAVCIIKISYMYVLGSLFKMYIRLKMLLLDKVGRIRTPLWVLLLSRLSIQKISLNFCPTKNLRENL